ncbi:MAG TPA: hypothetical protein VFB72_15645, partial [Verrucomicrobiae bacterium]|nr:hypothetical protein [Verrucomicrobiae bacterium]
MHNTAVWVIPDRGFFIRRNRLIAALLKPFSSDRNRLKAILECGGMTPLFFRATCRPVPKRGHVRALQIK